MTAKPMRLQVEGYIQSLQDQIINSLESLDPNAPSFKRDDWTRAESGGFGKSCVFAVPATPESAVNEPTTILEKGGVNISVVHGTLPPAAIKQMRADHSSLPDAPPGGLPFFAAGISLVIHPRNPHAPTVHANYRYFEVSEPDTDKLIAWWFGGGADLTPSYLYQEDAVHFHQTLKDASGEYYPEMKKWCDEYFYIPHRKESRGVGGIFFDDLNDEDHKRLSGGTRTQDSIMSMVKKLGDAFIPAYLPILSKRHSMPFTPHQRRWQLVRRGRYVEFNLIYDRGTKFGLNAPHARVESILMSLPEVARWEYQCDMGDDENSEEGKLLAVLRSPKEWLN
ncbi:Coproporphyrinogen oxidase [Mycena floridula]|nr:Coproporphyrinogen oxidase [Mycena floridula]